MHTCFNRPTKVGKENLCVSISMKTKLLYHYAEREHDVMCVLTKLSCMELSLPSSSVSYSAAQSPKEHHRTINSKSNAYYDLTLLSFLCRVCGKGCQLC